MGDLGEPATVWLFNDPARAPPRLSGCRMDMRRHVCERLARPRPPRRQVPVVVDGPAHLQLPATAMISFGPACPHSTTQRHSSLLDSVPLGRQLMVGNVAS
jgi:hypothetical protein